MARNRDFSNLSQLEREFELEMDEEGADNDELETSLLEVDDDVSELELEQDGFEHSDEVDDARYEAGDDAIAQEYVERLMELGGRDFETEGEVDQALNEVLDGMAREYLFGRLRKGLRSLTQNPVLRGLARKGLKLGVSKFFPGVQAALQLAKGNVKGALLNFGKQALGTVVPGGTATLDALKSLGIGIGPNPAQNRESWENYVSLSREAFEHLADNLTETADHPAEAARLANNAIQHAVHQVQQSVPSTANRVPRRGRTVRLRIKPGQRLNLIIVGG